ncbi:hypothetical protein TgHK011_007920 [Trichoderma gracile]|nr:hypothetical protein TgHK011_007920 [Trichoderma gracile]
MDGGLVRLEAAGATDASEEVAKTPGVSRLHLPPRMCGVQRGASPPLRMTHINTSWISADGTVPRQCFEKW